MLVIQVRILKSKVKCRNKSLIRTLIYPHFLELDPNFIESLRDDSNKDILDHPCQEKYHRNEVNIGVPMLC